jgi:iron(III) transport system ATP-binding protein
VAFGLARSSPAEQRARVMEMLHLVGMPGLAKRYPHQLSGGERQRVALARALAPRPALLLLDEPFSSLDADLRREVREQVRLILKALQVSALFVTHDQEEALYMGDRLAVLNAGRLEQIGTPEQVFHHAATRFVAGFMGNSDFLPGQLVPGGVLTGAGLLRQPVWADGSGQVEIALRGDDLDFASAEAGNGNGRILARQFLGAWNLYRLELDSGQVLHAFKDHTCLLPVGERVQVSLTPGHRLVVFQDGKVVG